MKLRLLTIAALLPFSALASNTITFSGEVVASTCSVSVDGGSTNTVTLPTVTTTALANAGSTAGETKFELQVTGCTADETVGLQFYPIQALSSGNLANTVSGGAGNVSIQILDNNDSYNPITFTASGYESKQTVTLATSDVATFPYTARYYAEGTSTAGKVESQLQYTIVYK